MGLCKCPRRKVTPLFCAEHRLNVCDHCMVEKHPQCIIKPYKEWLQDSDYDPTCAFCKGVLKDSPPDSVVRLECLHVFHLSCLHAWGSSMPAHTAPAGYQCVLCRQCVIPKPNAASPVANALRTQLTQCNWARQGLGLAMLPELENLIPSSPPIMHNNSQQDSTVPGTHMSQMMQNGTGYYPSDDYEYMAARKMQQQTLQMENQQPLLSSDGDVGEAKYKRRPVMEWLRRWLKSRSITGGRGRASAMGRKRQICYGLLALLAIATLVAIMGRIAPPSDAYDPFLDPLANPNIQIGPDEDLKAGGNHL